MLLGEGTKLLMLKHLLLLLRVLLEQVKALSIEQVCEGIAASRLTAPIVLTVEVVVQQAVAVPL